MDNFLRQIIDAFPGMVFIKDLDGVYINCSDAFAKFTGNKSPADVIGKKTFEILPKSSAQWAVHLDKLLFETHQPNSEIYPFSLENKNYSKWQRVSRRPLHDEEGNLIGLVGTLEDIGDVVALTDELAASKARFRALSETMDFNSFVVAMWDADTLELDFVSDNIRYLGLKHNRLAHMNDWANNVHPDDIDDYWDCRKPLLEQSQNVDFWHEYRILNKNGEVKWINERLSFVALPSAHLYRSVIIDTTARHEHGNIREHAQFTGEESVGGLQMLDIVSRDYLQQLCNTVTKTLGVSSFISDPSGSPITQREGLCTFCDIISSTEKGSTLCRHSHSNLCIAARENDGLVIETCDAIGLCNAVIPITVSGKLMGFWAIGRLNVTGSITEENIRALCQKLSISESEALPAFHDMPSYSFHDAKILFNELIPYVNDLSGYLYQSCLLMHEAERMIKSQEFISRSLKLDSLQNYLFDTFFSAQNTKDDNTRFHDALESIGSYFGFNRAIVLGSRAKHSEPLFQWHEQGLSALPPRLMDTQTVDCLYRFASNLHNAHHISRDDLPESWRESIFVIGHCYTYSAEFHGKCAGVVVLLQDNSRAMLDGDELESLSHVLGAFGSYLVSKQMERGAFELTDSLKLILDNLKDEVYVIDRETYEVVFANANFNGKAITAPCGVSCFRLLGHNAPCRCCGLDMVKDLPEGCDYTFQTNENDGGLWRSYTITPVEWRGSRPVYLVSARDITEEKLREQEYIEAATFDTALNIPNIGRLTSRLDTLLKTGKNGSLFVIDIDNFKLINNAYGYDYSDALLEEITYFLKSVIPPSYVYRYSTSKFAVLYENADYTQTDVFIKDLYNRFNQEWRIKDKLCYSSFSASMVHYGADSGTTSGFLRDADVALDRAAADRGRNSFYSPDKSYLEDFAEKIELANGLHKMVIDGCDDLVVHYQPVYQGDKIVHAEIFMRWRHPELGVISPDKFIKLAEDASLIAPLSEKLLDTAISQCKKWQSDHPGLKISVNFSAAHSRQVGVIEKISNMLKKHDLPPNCLIIEIHEKDTESDKDHIFSFLRSVREIGCLTAVDNFGTGMFSFSMLQYKPVDLIKLDRCIVADICDNKCSQSFVRFLTELHIDLEISAVGVENAEQLKTLNELGIRLCQGYLLGKPVPANEVFH